MIFSAKALNRKSKILNKSQAILNNKPTDNMVKRVETVTLSL